MAPQILQEKAPNPDLASEALHSLVATAPSCLPSLCGCPGLGVWAPVLHPLSSHLDGQGLLVASSPFCRWWSPFNLQSLTLLSRQLPTVLAGKSRVPSES